MSKGQLQYDMWGVTPTSLWDWAALKSDIAKYGVRNSLLVAPMPTASTAQVLTWNMVMLLHHHSIQILGNNESIEPFTSNIYARRVLSGEFQVVNKHLLKDLVERGLWTDSMKNQLIAENGSVQRIAGTFMNRVNKRWQLTTFVAGIPDDLKALYKTVWEISQKSLIDMAADRGAFIDQSQSFNVHVAQPNFAKMTSMHFYAWKKGLKTGMYYLRTRPAADAIKFTVDQTQLAAVCPMLFHLHHFDVVVVAEHVRRQADGGGEAGLLEGQPRGLPDVQCLGPRVDVRPSSTHSSSSSIVLFCVCAFCTFYILQRSKQQA